MDCSYVMHTLAPPESAHGHLKASLPNNHEAIEAAAMALRPISLSDIGTSALMDRLDSQVYRAGRRYPGAPQRQRWSLPRA